VTSSPQIGCPGKWVRLPGDIGGADIGAFCDTLAALVDCGDELVLIDLSGLSSWSLVAQAMVFRTARRLQTQGRQMALVAPDPELVDCSARLNIFGLFDSSGDRSEHVQSPRPQESEQL
jgi:anti-anti-sigma regulatory factor